jgi:hypothetical protein
MSREASDNLYIDLGYFTPEEYYVYEAEADAVLSSSTTVTANVGFLKQANAVLATNVTLSADAGIVKQAEATLASASSVAVTGSKLVSLIRQEPVTWDEIESWTDWYRTTWDPDYSNENYQVISSLTADGRRIKLFDADLNSISNLSASITNTVNADIVCQSQATLQATALRTKQLAANILSEGFVVTAAGKIADFFVPMQVSSTLTVDANTNILGDVVLSSNSTLLADADVVRSAQINLNSQSGLTAQVNATVSIDAVLQSQAALSAEITTLIFVSAALSAEVNLTAQTQGTVTAGANLTSNTSLQTIGQRRASLNADILSQSNLDASIDRVVTFSSNIQSNGFILVAGRALQLDPYLTYVIEQESRTFVITGESRLFTVAEDSRVYIITEETRDYTVEPNTLVNII